MKYVSRDLIGSIFTIDIQKKEYFKWLTIISVVVILLYWQLIASDNTTIDTEDVINLQGSFYFGWLAINRFGLVLTKTVFSQLSIIPPLSSFLMMITTVIYGFVWMLLISWLEGKKTLLCGGVFSLLFITSIPLLEISTFQCLSFEVAFAMVIAGISLYSLWLYIDSKNTVFALAFIFLSVWVYGSYQAFVPLMAAALSMTFLIRYTNNGDGIEKKYPLKVASVLSVLFFLSICIYLLIGRLIIIVLGIPSGDYTTNMILLGKVTFVELTKRFLSYIYGVFINPSYGWNRLYLISYIALPLTLLIYMHRLSMVCETTKKINGLFLFIAVVCSFTFPFVLPFITGGGLVRGQFSLPFVMALSIGISISIIFSSVRLNTKRSSIYVCLLQCCLSLLFIRWCIVPDVRLMWTDAMVKRQQTLVTEEIVSKVHSVGGSSESRVVFLGQWHPKMNGSMKTGEILGKSFYEWDSQVQGGTNRRVLGYMRVMGYEFANPTNEDIAYAERIGSSIPVYPTTNYVVKYGDLIIVRLS